MNSSYIFNFIHFDESLLQEIQIKILKKKINKNNKFFFGYK